MKHSAFFSLILCLISLSSFGQEEISTEKFDASRVERISLDFKYPELIKIKTWDKKEVEIKASVIINNGQNNEDFSLKSRVNNGTLLIDSKIRNLDKYRHYTISRDEDGKNGGLTVSKNGSTIITNGRGYWKGRDGVVVSVILEVTVPEGIEVDLEATYGIVEVLDHEMPLEIDARYGGIDVLIDEKADLEISASTQWGQIYHNLDAKLRARGDGFPGKWMRTQANLNRGTRKLSLESQYGNVYLRKSN